MSGYETTMRKLSESTKDGVLKLWSLVDRGLMSEAEFTMTAADLLGIANSRGAAVADSTLRAYVEAETGAPDLTRGISGSANSARLERSLTTILASDKDTIMQLTRLATSEPLTAGINAFSEGIRKHPRVKGWTRGVEFRPCELCIWWARDGRVWPATHPMPTHKGCVCHPVPVISTNVKAMSYDRSSGGYDQYRAGLDRRAGN